MSPRLLEIAGLFLKLGSIGFGGPATHLALMEDEVVARRGWLSRQHFLDLVGATNLIPGPNSTEMAIHIGFVRGGWAGLVVAGAAFILPAALITTALAWLYVEHGRQPEVEPIIAGIKPAVLAVIFTAGWRLGRKALDSWIVGAVFAAAAVASLCGAGEITVLLACSLTGMLWLCWHRHRRDRQEPIHGLGLGAVLLAGTAGSSPHGAKPAIVASLAAAAAATASTGATLGQLAWFFLKVGAVLYGTGYVLIAYLQGGLVREYGWLSDEQLLDAIAIGQFTPGPIVSTATFIGYVVMSVDGGPWRGLAGAAVATVAIFLPSFVFVAVTNPIVPRLRRSRWTAAFLDAVNAASLGLMAAVTIRLAGQIFFPSAWHPNATALLIAAAATVAALRWKAGAIWLVLGGAAAGWLGWWLGCPAT
jgi:chromate transporter